MTALKPCRFCGESDKLDLGEGWWETSWAIDEAGAVIRDVKGEPTSDVEPYRGHHHIDQVTCRSCEAMASLRVWNATPEFIATMLANIAAADAEYSEDGEWLGRNC